MSGLQEAFYIIAIVFMAVMFVILIVLVTAVFVIKSKINHIQRSIENRLSTAVHLAEKGGELAGLAASKVARAANRASRKARR